MRRKKKGVESEEKNMKNEKYGELSERERKEDNQKYGKDDAQKQMADGCGGGLMRRLKEKSLEIEENDKKIGRGRYRK